MRLLVADDNAQWRSIIAQKLACEHQVVGFAERGDQIIAAAEKIQPELITLDVRMPGESGLNVLPRLRKVLPNAVIVIVAATSMPLYKEAAFTRGADGYVDKRKIMTELLQTISAVLKNRAKQTQPGQ